MTFNVSYEVKSQLLQDRITALNLEGYQNELNLKSAKASGNDEVIAQAQANIEVIQSAIQVHTAELESL
jgi:uncharacterized protein with FMN-binding domain